MCNVLSFVMERVNLPQEDGQGSYLAFIYVVDGKRIENEEYNPADSYDVIDEYAEKQNLVVLNHCTCGVWACSSLVARVSVNDNQINWDVSELRGSSKSERYTFEKIKYDKVISEIKRTAASEIKKINMASKFQIIIRMEPDYESLFIFEKGNDASATAGETIGTDEYVKINGQTIYFQNPELKEWNKQYVQKVLIPCESGKKTIEEINRTFDWQEFHKTGIRLAMEIKKQLPSNVVLTYSAPFEDRSGVVKEVVRIQD